jgi:hypothetical protein
LFGTKGFVVFVVVVVVVASSGGSKLYRYHSNTRDFVPMVGVVCYGLMAEMLK